MTDSPQAMEHKIIEFDPPRVVDYGGLRFELEPVDGGTQLTFIHSFPPDHEFPWHPDFCAGFHTMLDRLPAYLDGKWTHEDTLADLKLMPEGTEEYRALSKRYRELLLDEFDEGPEGRFGVKKGDSRPA